MTKPFMSLVCCLLQRVWSGVIDKEIPLFVVRTSIRQQTRGFFIYVLSFLLNANLRNLVAYTYDVGTTSEGDASAVVSNLSLVNELTIDSGTYIVRVGNKAAKISVK